MTESSTPEDAQSKLIRSHTEAVGMLTIYWASLENTLITVIQRLLQTDEMTANCIGASIEKAAGRTALIQRLILRPGESPADEWRDCMLGLCDQISNVIGPRRNRLIHDDWTISEETFLRHNTGVRIGKPSEREAKTLLTHEPAPSDDHEIWKLTGKVIDLAFYVLTVSYRYDQWKRTGQYPPLNERAIQVSKGIAPERSLPIGEE